MATHQPLMLSDCYGLPVTTHSQEAVQWFDQGLRGLLGFRKDTAQCFQHALDLDPAFNLAQSYLGVHYFLEESEEMVARAQACFTKANENTARLTEREGDVIETLSLWAGGKVGEAMRRMHAAIEQRPQEIVLIQRLYFVYFVQGAAEKFHELIAGLLPHYDDDPYLLGMYSFALEETGDFARAFDIGHQALAANPEDVWALHALAHVAYETGDFAAGVRLLEEGLQHCDNVGTFRHHVLWHLALFLWEQGHYQQVLHLYHEEFADPQGLLPFELVDSASLLWRLNLTGQATPEEWEALQPSLDTLRRTRTYLFNQMHVMLGLTGAHLHEWAQDYVDACRTRVRPDRPSLLGEVGVPLAEALVASMRGEYARVVEVLAPIRERIVEIGGSHAQREVFTDILLDACLRTEAYDLARELVHTKLRHRPERPLTLFTLEKICAAQGDREQAEVAGNQARTLLQTMGADAAVLQYYATP